MILLILVHKHKIILIAASIFIWNRHPSSRIVLILLIPLPVTQTHILLFRVFISSASSSTYRILVALCHAIHRSVFSFQVVYKLAIIFRLSFEASSGCEVVREDFLIALVVGIGFGIG